MAFTSPAFFLLCGIIGLTGVWSFPVQDDKDGCCPKGWTQLDKRCFIYKDDNRTFSDAESICKVIGGNLASIRSALENVVVLQVIKKGADPVEDTWIGLHEAIEEDDYIWTDGSEFDFSDFNDESNDGDCVEIGESDKLWTNDICETEHPYVCAKDAECKH
ncbi:galactose-specific lectin nattectin-like [Nerophis lumbriciformis]|uniref:galactose-specific lectin nattectin-like n=1 Tax=Nerophis lumbriciformis TaxID=546530 RepID=UPI002ADF4BC6|nr:galactose-specific lectin nattectin-like [Nerophis lumbriciformis]